MRFQLFRLPGLSVAVLLALVALFAGGCVTVGAPRPERAGIPLVTHDLEPLRFAEAALLEVDGTTAVHGRVKRPYRRPVLRSVQVDIEFVSATGVMLERISLHIRFQSRRIGAPPAFTFMRRIEEWPEGTTRINLRLRRGDGIH